MNAANGTAGGRILQDRSGPIATIRISNPDKYNAMSLSMWQAFIGAVRAIAADPTVRVLLLRGDGDRAFMSGADIGEFERTRSAETGSEVYDAAVDQAQAALVECPFPVVAAIRGVCMGGGLGLAMACDLRYAATDARFRMPAARLGLGYSPSGIRRMIGQIGAARVADLFFTARTFDGAEAARLGIVNATYDAEVLHDEARRIAALIAENAPLTLALAKRTIAWVESGSDPQAVAALERMRRDCLASADYVEGRRAFAEKRPPRFTGKARPA